jgi:Ser/Thr protein kinase RdoA (MazF antagonist)
MAARITTARRAQFSPGELAVVLSHYDVGVIASARDFPRGSRHSPKLLLCAADGRQFLLKKRAAGQDDPFRVAFTHVLLTYLRERRFPVPALIGTRDDQNSLLQLNGATYEMFEYIVGERYNGSLDQTQQAGELLRQFHDEVREFQTEWASPAGAYHDCPTVRQALNAIPATTAGHDSVIGHEAELLTLVQDLYERYDAAAERVTRCGADGWARRIIHGDWHPGNLLFREGRLAAVLDLDSARLQPPILDVANGLLQFSILRTHAGPDEWPSAFDEARMQRFWAGYGLRANGSSAQCSAITDLMIESLIAEAVLPIAETGSFGHLTGFGVLKMVRRKAEWLAEHRERLTRQFEAK